MKLDKYFWYFFVSFILLFLLSTIPFYASAQATYPNLAQTNEFRAYSPSQAQENWITQLANCESGDKPEIRPVLDVNNKYSFGWLQFQLGTWMTYGKLYKILPDEFTNKEGLLLIQRQSIQKAIAKEMLNSGLQDHWRNCVSKIGYDYPVIDI